MNETVSNPACLWWETRVSCMTSNHEIAKSSNRERRKRKQTEQNSKKTSCFTPPPRNTFWYLTLLSYLFSPVAGNEEYRIGDGVRSTSSSTSFFKSVDCDGDGTLSAPEVASFLKNSIGGSAFDTSSEINSEVVHVMSNLDRNNDEGLSRSDIFAYWSQLESLLTAEEVADWVVNAVQLPDYIGRIFKSNVVTGYDFPELVENDGSALKELGIEKPSFRKKLVRHIHAKMLGIGTNPNPPSGIKHKIESCSSVSFTWDNGEMAVSKVMEKDSDFLFPVHTYRIQRRKIRLHGKNVSPAGVTNKSKKSCQNQLSLTDVDAKDICPTEFESLQQPISPSTPPLTSWLTVYSGSETEFYDNYLEDGCTYVYRLQAWNNVGHSPWLTVDIAKDLKKSNCLQKPRNYAQGSFPQNSGTTPTKGVLTPIKDFFHFGNILASIVHWVFIILGFITALMRWKRATTPSTMIANHRFLPPHLVRVINSFSQKILGVDFHILQGHQIQNQNDHSNSDHDTYMNATNLDGFSSKVTFHEGDTPEIRRNKIRQKVQSNSLKTQNGHGRPLPIKRDLSFRSLPAIEEIRGEDTLPPCRRLFNKKSRSVSCISVEEDVDDPHAGRRPIFRKSKSSKSGLGKRYLNDEAGKEALCPLVVPQNHSCSNFDSWLNDEKKVKKVEGNPNSPNQIKEAENTVDIVSSTHGEGKIKESKINKYGPDDDDTVCNTCEKKFKLGKRWRHHCARCLSTFCHKHGKTTHSNLTSCKVPGDCLCQKCLTMQLE